jgi:hypothetical protein
MKIRARCAVLVSVLAQMSAHALCEEARLDVLKQDLTPMLPMLHFESPAGTKRLY